MKNYTDITILLDRSGSMATIQDQMEKSFDEFITAHKVNPSTRVTLIEFDSVNSQNVVFQNVPVTSVEPLKLKPRGWTPLLDAFCTAIDTTGNRLASMDESERPNKVIFIAITDGQENSSTWAKRSDVKKRITHQHDTYKWEFVYLGANQDAYSEAATFGIARTSAMTYSHDTIGTASAMRSLTANTVAYANNQSLSTAFNKAQQDEAEENIKKAWKIDTTMTK